MIPEPTGIAALDHVLVWGSVLSVVLGAATGLWRLVRGLLKLAQRAHQFFDDWYGEGERPGFPARPGVLERVGEMERGFVRLDQRVEGLAHELYPNDGGSLRDAVDLANCRLARLAPDDGPCIRHTGQPFPDRPPSPGAS